MSRFMRNRLVNILTMVIVGFVLVFFRVIYLTTLKSEAYTVITNSQYTKVENTSDINFSVIDRNGKDLLKHKLEYYVVIDSFNYVTYNDETNLDNIKVLKYMLMNYDKNYDPDKITKQKLNGLTYLKVDRNTYDKIKTIQESVSGVYTYYKSIVNRENTWLYQNMISSFKNLDGTDKDTKSIENKIKEATKDNYFPNISYDIGIDGIYKEEKISENDENINVKLTTDINMQNKIKDIIDDKIYNQYDEVGVAISKASTGEILAMTQKNDAKPNILLGSATENGYEPASIFKTIVAGTAIENEIIPIDQTLKSVDNYHSGFYDMWKAYSISSNSYFRQVGFMTGFQNVLVKAKKMGLFRKTLGFSGNGEVKGSYVLSEEKKSDYDAKIYAGDNYSFGDNTENNLFIGQSMQISMIQALAIPSTIINSGIYVQSNLLKSFNKGDTVVQNFEPEKTEVFREDTAKIMQNMMRNVVRDKDGTGHDLNDLNMDLGGKTGTNTRIENGKNFSDGWFVGFYQHKGEYYSIAIFVKNIDVENQSSENTAVPIAKRIIESIAK